MVLWTEKEYYQGITTDRKKELEMLKNLQLPKHEVVRYIDLKARDKIIHENRLFLVDSCLRGNGAGNEFGVYMCLKGYWINSLNIENRTKLVTPCWGYEMCPVIRILE